MGRGRGEGTEHLLVLEILTVMWACGLWGWGRDIFVLFERILMVSLRSSRSQSMALRQFLSSLVLQSSSSRLTYEAQKLSLTITQSSTHPSHDLNHITVISFSLMPRNQFKGVEWSYEDINLLHQAPHLDLPKILSWLGGSPESHPAAVPPICHTGSVHERGPSAPPCARAHTNTHTHFISTYTGG